MEKPEYESLNALGSMCLNDNLEGVMKAIDLCNRYGLDTISAGTTIAFAMECFDRGIIDEKDTGGVALTWGNVDATLAMIEQMGMRRGFGAVLADGTRKAAERIGRGSEQYAVQVHGSELPMHNPRQFPGTGHIVAYSCDPTPAHHVQSRGITNIEIARDLGPYPEFRGSKADMDDFQAKIDIYRRGHSWFHFVEACGTCSFVMNTGTTDRRCGTGRHRMGLHRRRTAVDRGANPGTAAAVQFPGRHPAGRLHTARAYRRTAADGSREGEKIPHRRYPAHLFPGDELGSRDRRTFAEAPA